VFLKNNASQFPNSDLMVLPISEGLFYCQSTIEKHLEEVCTMKEWKLDDKMLEKYSFLKLDLVYLSHMNTELFALTAA
jgi:hypothetical protein